MRATAAFSRRVRDGTLDAEGVLAALHREHYAGLVRLGALLVGDVGQAEEAVQDAFVRVQMAMGRVRDLDALPAYLRSTVVNLARSRLRRRALALRHHPERTGESASAEERAMLREDRREVIAALRRLPARQRECLVLRYYLDLSDSEIATTLGVSPGSVKTHLHRGMASMARLLEGLR